MSERDYREIEIEIGIVVVKEIRKFLKNLEYKFQWMCLVCGKKINYQSRVITRTVNGFVVPLGTERRFCEECWVMFFMRKDMRYTKHRNDNRRKRY